MPLSEDTLRRALDRLGVQAPVRFDEVTGSTNATALSMAEAGAPEWTLVAAGHQTEGRGRLGRAWVDEPGTALMFSLVLRPDLAPELGGLIPLLAGAAMARACEDVAGAEVACKWPNDLLLGAAKVGGILSESLLEGEVFEFVVLGVGVNLGTPPPVEGSGALGADPEELLGAFLDRFAHHYEPGHPAFAGAVASYYREVCTTLGRRVRAIAVDGGVVEGEAVDVDEHGALVIRVDGGLEAVRFGEVEHLETALPG